MSHATLAALPGARRLDGVTAAILVTLQAVFMTALMVPTGPVHHPLWVPALLVVAGAAWLAWTLAVNPPHNIHIRPIPKPGGRLVTTGPYRLVRHPMYFGVLLFCAGPPLLWPSWWKLAAWLALVAVLWTKARREETALCACFPEYPAFRRARRFLIPGLW